MNPDILRKKYTGPKSFLSRITSRSPMNLTTTEEIFDSEHQLFTNKITQSIPKYPSSRTFLPPNLQHPSPAHLPPIISHTQKSLKSTSHSPKKPSIHKILQLHQASLLNSSKLKLINQEMQKNALIAKQYTKEFDWASSTLTELSGFNETLMKKLFIEMKSSKEMLDEDNKNLVSDLSQRIIVEKKYRARNFCSRFQRKGKNFDKKCISRELNPGRDDGNVPFYP